MELPESEVADESHIVVPSTSASTSLDIEIIPEKPNHPVMSQFPLRTFGKQGLFAHHGTKNILGYITEKLVMTFSTFTAM